MDWMDATIQQQGKGYICVAATHTVVATQDDPELRAAVCNASLVVPDGQPRRVGDERARPQPHQPRLRP